MPSIDPEPTSDSAATADPESTPIEPDEQSEQSEPAAARLPQRRARTLTAVLVGVALLVVALDQVTKAWAQSQFSDGDSIELLGGWLTLTYTRNPGAAFNLGTGTTWVFTIIATVVVVVILRASRQLGSLGWAIALGALLGGAMGNLLDRIFRDPGFLRGYVVDWIQVPHFPVFNIADSAITCAAIGLVVLGLFGPDISGHRHGHTPEGS